tara:strand:- start:3595 stop:3885 length:291 start_codon:yes stop_codon:yes gene_type:complete
MFRSILTTLLGTAALLGTVSAFGDGPACDHGLPEVSESGNCIKKSACTTNEWVFGSKPNPLCDVAGSDYNLPDTLVCCMSTPEATHSETITDNISN